MDFSQVDWPFVLGTLGFLLFSLSVHEAAHAWSANLLGDPTGKDLGRITLNPLKHIDPVISVVLPVLLFITVGMIFGGAKPVPVRVENFKKPARDFMFVAIAGPISNVILGFLFVLVMVGLHRTENLGERTDLLWACLSQAVLLNFLLAFFNMMPVPPLDGSRVLAFLLPGPLRRVFQKLDYAGFFIILILIYFGAFTWPYRNLFLPWYDGFIRPLMP